MKIYAFFDITIFNPCVFTHLHQFVPIEDYARNVFVPSLN